MNESFYSISAALSQARLTELANQPVDTGELLLASFLPEERVADFTARTGGFKVIPVMAGLVGMDSPYTPGGTFEATVFSEGTIKSALRTEMPEAFIREVMQMAQQIQLRNVDGDLRAYLIDQFLNWTDVIGNQGLSDRREYTRGLALSTGMIQTTEGDGKNKKTIAIDFGVPAENKPAKFTGANGFGGTTSQFKGAIRSARRRLKGGIRAVVMSDDTLQMILDNPAHGFVVTAENVSPQGNIRTVQVQTALYQGGQTVAPAIDRDVNATYTLIGYSRTVNLRTTAGTLVETQAFPDGVVSVIGNNTRVARATTQGGVVQRINALGHTHIGPTVEGGLAPGMFLNAFVDPKTPWQVDLQAAQNFLPLIETPSQLYLIQTDVV